MKPSKLANRLTNIEAVYEIFQSNVKTKEQFQNGRKTKSRLFFKFRPCFSSDNLNLSKFLLVFLSALFTHLYGLRMQRRLIWRKFESKGIILKLALLSFLLFSLQLVDLFQLISTQTICFDYCWSSILVYIG